MYSKWLKKYFNLYRNLCVIRLLLKQKNSSSPATVESEYRYARWKKAVQKSMNWETTEPASSGNGEWCHLENETSNRLGPLLMRRLGFLPSNRWKHHLQQCPNGVLHSGQHGDAHWSKIPCRSVSARDLLVILQVATKYILLQWSPFYDINLHVVKHLGKHIFDNDFNIKMRCL